MSLPPDFSAVPTRPPAAPDGWLPGLPAPASHPPALAQRWGLPDIVIGFVFIIVIVAVATVLGLAIGGLDTMDQLVDGDLSGADTLIFLALTSFGQGAAMGSWPVIVARWKGNGVRNDFGWRFEWVDIAYGLGIGGLMLFLAGGVGYGVSALVGLDPGAGESTNTQIISDASGGPAFFIILMAAVVIAPIAEELFFRGLCLRAIEKRFGTVAAVLGSTFLFTLPHFTNPSLAGTTVLFAVIGSVGLVLAVLTVKTGRIGAAVIAHAVFNGVGVAATLAAV